MLSNSSLDSSVKSAGRGNGGNIKIRSRLLSLNNEARITVDSESPTNDRLSETDGGEQQAMNNLAGDIDIVAGSIRLNNRSEICANTQKRPGATIGRPWA